MLTRENIKLLAQVEEGVPLFGCEPGSPAAFAGLQYGDIVLSVDGKRTRTVEEYIAAKEEDIEHVVVYRRGAETRTARIAPGPSVWPDMWWEMAEAVGVDSFWTHRTARAPTHRD